MSCLRLRVKRGTILAAVALSGALTVTSATIPSTGVFQHASTASALAASVTTPTGLTATVSGSNVNLNWDDNTGTDFSYFAVRRGTQPDPNVGTWTRLAPNYTTSQAVDS